MEVMLIMIEQHYKQKRYIGNNYCLYPYYNQLHFHYIMKLIYNINYNNSSKNLHKAPYESFVLHNLSNYKRKPDNYDFPPEKFYNNLYSYNPNKTEENLQLILNELEKIKKITDEFYEEGKEIKQKLLDYENEYKEERTFSLKDLFWKTKKAENNLNYQKNFLNKTKAFSIGIPAALAALGLTLTYLAPPTAIAATLITAINVVSYGISTKLSEIHIEQEVAAVKAEQAYKDAKAELEVYQKEKLDGLTLDEIILKYEPLKEKNDKLIIKNSVLEDKNKELKQKCDDFQKNLQSCNELYQKLKEKCKEYIKPEKPDVEIDVSGKWNTNFGEMILNQSGTTVTGTYTHDKGRIEGVLKGNVFIGTWSEAPTYSPSHDAGKVKLIFNNDSFTGKWGSGDDEPTNPWTGTRIKD